MKSLGTISEEKVREGLQKLLNRETGEDIRKWEVEEVIRGFDGYIRIEVGGQTVFGPYREVLVIEKDTAFYEIYGDKLIKAEQYCGEDTVLTVATAYLNSFKGSCWDWKKVEVRR